MSNAEQVQELKHHYLEMLSRLDVGQKLATRPELISGLLDMAESLCDNVLKASDAPHYDDMFADLTVMGIEGALHNTIGVMLPDTRFAELLSSYYRARVSLHVLNRETVFSGDCPIFSVPTIITPDERLIVPGEQSSEGVLVNGVSNLWWEIVRKIRLNPDLVHQFDWRVWEEIVAGAYKEDGWSTVILTPRSGDKGRDVIAKKEGHGELRFLHLDQVKAFGPNEKVGPSDIREMIGVLSRERGATKGIITTTGTFTAGAIEEASTFDPRLELRPRIKLVTWLARLMKNRNRKLE